MINMVYFELKIYKILKYFDAKNRVMFTFPNYTYRQGLKNEKKLLWPDQAIMFSSNQCLIDRTVGHGFTKCDTARFICKANHSLVYGKEERTFEQSLKKCELINGQLCKLF